MNLSVTPAESKEKRGVPGPQLKSGYNSNAKRSSLAVPARCSLMENVYVADGKWKCF